MAKKHIRNQSTSLSTSLVLPSRESTGKTSTQNQETSTTAVRNSYLTYGKVSQPSSNPFQFVKTRVEDSSGSSISRQFQATPSSVVEPACQYHYYQTNSTKWMSQAEYKHKNINCWLDNVLKNNQNKTEDTHEGFETDNTIHDDREQVNPSIENINASCLFKAKRYRPYQACAKRELPIIDQNETNCRQEKIRTLKTLITRHDEHLNGLKLCRNIDPDKQRCNHIKKLHGSDRWNTVGQIEEHQCKPKSNGKQSIKEKKTSSFDIRNPNSIFLAVLEEEQIARRRSVGWGCCASESLSGQQDELYVELENISAS